ncbi:MAG TPA: hypothetical protein VGV89_08035 [Thermoplasmata archaeon]|nr:hypothetical protein [Thermoplasmata archaeon]
MSAAELQISGYGVRAISRFISPQRTGFPRRRAFRVGAFAGVVGSLIVVLLLASMDPGLAAHSSVAPVSPIGKAAAPVTPPPSGSIYGQLTINAGIYEETSAYAAPHQELFVPSVFGGVDVINTTTNTRVAVNPGPVYPWAAVYDPSTDRVYVSDRGNASVDIQNPSHPTNYSTFSTGPPGGAGIGYDPVSGYLWVGDSSPYGYLVTIDPLTGGYTYMTYIAGAIFDNFAYDNTTGFLYITYYDSAGSYLLAYDDSTGILVNDSASGNPLYVTVDTAAGLIVTANGTGLTYYDESNQTDYGIGSPVFTFNLPANGNPISALAFEPQLGVEEVARGYDFTRGDLYEISAVGPTPAIVADITTGAYPSVITFDPDNNNLYVGQYASMMVLAGGAFSIAGTAPDPTFRNVCCEQSILYVPTARTLFVLVPNATKSVIGVFAAGGRHGLLHTVTVGPYAQAMVFDPLTNSVLAWNDGNQTLSAVNAKTYAVTQVNVPGEGFSMAYDPVHGTIGMSDYFEGNFTVLDAKNYKVLANFPIGATPGGVAYDPQISAFVTTHLGSATNLSVVQGTTHLYDQNFSWYCTCAASGVTYDPATGDLVVQFNYAAGVALLNGHTLRTVRVIADFLHSGVSPNSQEWATMAYDPADQDMFVFGYNFHTAYYAYAQPTLVVNGRGQQAAEMVAGATTDWPQGAAYDPVTHQVVVTSYSSLTFFGS